VWGNNNIHWNMFILLAMEGLKEMMPEYTIEIVLICVFLAILIYIRKGCTSHSDKNTNKRILSGDQEGDRKAYI
jgi:hypothetical protein